MPDGPAGATARRYECGSLMGSLCRQEWRHGTHECVRHFAPSQLKRAVSLLLHRRFDGLELLAGVRPLALCGQLLVTLQVLPDGGQALVNVIESVRRKPLSEAFLIRFQQVGIVMILLLMAYVTFNDVVRKVTEMIP